jgi:hypothetical protein
MWALVSLRSICQLKYPAVSSSDLMIRVFSRLGLSAPPPTPGYPEGRCFLSGLSPLASPNFKASGSRSLPLHDSAVYTLPRSHDMDMHATDLVGKNCITHVLLVYTCQQGVYPRGHVLPLRLPKALLPLHYISKGRLLLLTPHCLNMLTKI